MPDLVEKRQSARHSIKLPFLYKRKAPEPGLTGVGWTHNLSEDGGCLELTDRLKAPSALQVLFQTDKGGLDLSAVVVWAAVVRPEGSGILHGVAFPDLAPDQRQALRELLRSGG